MRDALAHVAGPHLDHVLRNIGVTGPVDLISGWLTIDGNAPRSGTEEEAIVCIWPGEPVAVQAAIFSHGEIKVLSTSDSYMNLPLAIKDWITQVNSLHRNRMTQPANVELVVTPL